MPLGQVIEGSSRGQVQVQQVVQVGHAAGLPRRHDAAKPAAFRLSCSRYGVMAISCDR